MSFSRPHLVWSLALVLLVGQSARPADAPGSTAAEEGPALRRAPFKVEPSDREWWAFQPVRPQVIAPGVGRHPIDALLAVQRGAAGPEPNPRASRREEIRRLSFDLHGLPPTPETVAAYEADAGEDAWERLVDRFLSHPAYGERWGRHWLDLVRFAESNGYERDGAKPEAWRYRDYVVQSFNKDKPFDRFIVEQLAGDELPGFSAEAIVATGFYRLHVWDDEPDSTLVAEFDDLDDILVTTSAAFLGMTVGCARCHDHKFDPISQEDYYRFLAYFRSINPYGRHHTGGGGRGTGRITRPLVPHEEFGRWELERTRRVAGLRARLDATTSAEERRRLEAEMDQVTKQTHPFPLALAISEDPVQPTRILRRGDVLNPGPEVQPGMPGILGLAQPAIVPPGNQPATSGRRLAMARWIADPGNPLTARVLVNRIWQHHFGVGIVATPNDFGRTGLRPTHPALLDWLAHALVEGGWRIKNVHRLIVTSAAYRMSSRADRPEALRLDEANRGYWRQNPRRLEGEALRDTLLAIPGSLNPRMGGPGFFPTLPPEVHRTQDAAGKGWGESPAEEQDRRSLYIFAKRALADPLLESFDCPVSTTPVGVRSVTTVAPQALMLLNDPFVRRQADRLCRVLDRECGSEEDRWIRRAFERVLQRPPTLEEHEAATRFLRSTAGVDRGVAGGPDPRPTRVNFCAALFNLNELLHVD